MAHPHRSEALSSSRTKMRAMTGAGGGGSPFLGSSPFKCSGSDGELKSYHSHEKQFQPHVAGGKSKKRADRFARGGRTKEQPRYDWEQVGSHDVKKDQPLKRGGRAEGGHTPGSASRLHQRIDLEKQMPGYGRLVGAQDAASGRGQGFEHGEAMHGALGGEGGEYKRGGRKAGGGPVGPGVYPAGSKGDLSYKGKKAPSRPYPSTSAKKDAEKGVSDSGGRYAAGGRTNPFGVPGKGSSGSRSPKRKAGNVSVNIMIPQGHHRPPMPPIPGQAGPADVMGAGPQAGPPAPAPVNPLAGMPGAGGAGMPGGAGGAGGAGPNPQALQALSQIASGAGGIGGGAGRGPFAKGGVAKSTGLSSNLKHWQGYAKRNVEHNTAHSRGATGESEELPLKTEQERSGASDWKTAQKRGDRGALKRASGGKIPVDVKGGADTGVGRKRKASLQPSWR